MTNNNEIRYSATIEKISPVNITLNVDGIETLVLFDKGTKNEKYDHFENGDRVELIMSYSKNGKKDMYIE